MAGADVTLLCVSFVYDVAFVPAVTRPRLVFGASVASVGTAVVLVTAAEC